MYYDITNKKQLRHLSLVKASRPNVSFPRVITEAILLEEKIAKLVHNKITPDEYQTVSVGNVVENNEVYSITDTLTNKPLELCIREQIVKINDTTRDTILSMASMEKQNNYQAKYTELLEKKFDMVITIEEESIMAELKQLWLDIETLVNTGNAKEALVDDCVTIDAIKTVIGNLK